MSCRQRRYCRSAISKCSSHRTRGWCARSMAPASTSMPGKMLGIVGEIGLRQERDRPRDPADPRPPRPHRRRRDLARPARPCAPVDIAQLDPRSPRDAPRCAASEIALIFQEPMTSFSAHYTIGNQISEAIARARGDAGKAASARSARSSCCCAWSASRDPERRIDEYPFQLSGGLQAARDDCHGARLRSAHPDRGRADHRARRDDPGADPRSAARPAEGARPVGASHHPRHGRHRRDGRRRGWSMYLGRIVERGPVDQIFHAPRHPYTRALLRSIPSTLAKPRSRLQTIEGSIPIPTTGRKAAHFTRAARTGSPGAATVEVPDDGPAGRRVGRQLLPLPVRLQPQRRGAGGMTATVLEVDNLKKHFPIRRGLLRGWSGR